MLRKAIEKFVRDFDAQPCSPIFRQLYRETHGIGVGIGSYGCFSPVAFPRQTVIGDYCSIGPGVRCLNANHPLNLFTTHPIVYNPALGLVNQDGLKRTALKIEHDVWTGMNSTILPTYTAIATGAAIGAGSIVARDVEPYTVVAGIPARPLRKRFDESTVARLLKSRWYELPPSGIASYRPTFPDITAFLDQLEVARHSTRV